MSDNFPLSTDPLRSQPLPIPKASAPPSAICDKVREISLKAFALEFSQQGSFSRLLTRVFRPAKFKAQQEHDAARVRDILADATEVLKEEPMPIGVFAHAMAKIEKVIKNLDESPFTKENKMSHEVADYFSGGKTKALREEKGNFVEGKVTKGEAEAHRLKRKAAKAELAMKFSKGKVQAKGTTGTLLLQDINRKMVGVLKVRDEDIPIRTKFSNFFKRNIKGQLSHLSRKRMAQPMAEKAAYLVSRDLGFDVVPAVEATHPPYKEKLLKQEGVFQVFVKKEKTSGGEYVEAAKGIEKFNEREFYYTESENTVFQKFAVFDYLIGNLDRHAENWFFVTNERGELTNIKGIDNANSFPVKNPAADSKSARNRFLWRELPIARQRFTQEVKEFISENLTEVKINEMIESINEQINGFLDGNMSALLKQRAQQIREEIIKEEATPLSLAERINPLQSASTRFKLLTRLSNLLFGIRRR